jgi:hypothetical protein
MVTALSDLRDTSAADLLEHDQIEITRKAVTVKKNGSRRAAADEATRMKDLTEASGASEEAMTALGFPKAGPAGESTSATVPIATIDNSKRLMQTINFADAATPGVKRKPKDVVGCEIWIKIDGPLPGSEKDCVFLALDTQTPYVVDFDPADAGKTAHYMIRWQFKDGSKSAWGETVSATITG